MGDQRRLWGATLDLCLPRHCTMLGGMMTLSGFDDAD